MMETSKIGAEIIAVGSELLTANRTDTNSLFITRCLNDLGIAVTRKTIVGDSQARISQALASALEGAQIVLLTGGLGPTNDDLTREAVSEALSRPLKLDPRALERLQKLYDRFGLRMTDNNRRQALVPEGAKILENPRGSAPGLFLQDQDRLIFLLPGPPRELHPMVENHVLPLIKKFKPTFRQIQRQLRVGSMAESAVDSRIESIYQAYPEIETTILSSAGIIDLVFQWKGGDNESLANQRLDELTESVRGELGKAVFADGPEDLEAVVGSLLVAKKLTLAVAESCTGGWMSKMVTDVAGSSAFFLGGVVSYSDSLKKALLGVSDGSLQNHGAVSEPVAIEMAEGVRRATGADVGVSITGIAGPDGGTPEKPVGLVWFGLSLEGTSKAKRRQLPGDREAIRLRSARFALDWLRKELL